MHQAYKKAAVLAIITLLGWGGIHSYYRYTQDMIYQESTDSLRATYTQVGTSFRLFTQRNWNILSVYEKNIQLLPAEYRTNEQWKVLLGERSQWMYRDFYLFDQAGNYVTDRGSRGADGQLPSGRQKCLRGREADHLELCVDEWRASGRLCRAFQRTCND